MNQPPVAAGSSKPDIIDYYVQTLPRVLGLREGGTDALRIYDASWQTHFGFCSDIDQESSGNLSGDGTLLTSKDSSDSLESSQPPEVKTKRLFVTGLSFYTSEKTLRASFEGFGELVEVKIIMDKISKRSKGYAFIEYTTEKAAASALKEMNGKIIYGWMIVVDVAKTNPPKYGRGRPRPLHPSSSY